MYVYTKESLMSLRRRHGRPEPGRRKGNLYSCCPRPRDSNTCVSHY